MASRFKQCGPENVIIMNRDRMTFGGPQVTSELVLGGYVIYVSVEQPFLLMIEGVRTERAFLAVVPPYAKHSVIGAPSVRSILVEAETVSPDLLRDPRFVEGGGDSAAWAMRIEEGFQCWESGTDSEDADSFDLFFFGERLPKRELDKRIAMAVERIRASPVGGDSAISVIANDAALSPSRLRHVFADQVGSPIRSFRAWKRLRNAIQISLQNPNILQLAMAAGYADATHLCHAVKFYFGEQPSFVCSHWRSVTFVRADGRGREAAGRAAQPSPNSQFATGNDCARPSGDVATDATMCFADEAGRADGAIHNVSPQLCTGGKRKAISTSAIP